MKKKITAALVCAAMVLSLSGCAENKQSDNFVDGPNSGSTGESKPTQSKPEASKPEESKPTESSSSSSSSSSISSSETTQSSSSKPQEQPSPPVRSIGVLFRIRTSLILWLKILREAWL